MRYLSCALVLILCAGATCAAAADKAKATTTAPAPDVSGPFRCTNQKHLINLNENDTGRTVEGPVCAQVRVNALRYYAYLGKTYKEPTAGPSLNPLPSAFQPSGAGAPEAVKQKSLEQEFKDISQTWKSLSKQWITQEKINRKQSAALAQELSELQSAVTQSDEVFNQSGPAGVIALKAQEPFKSATAAAVSGYQNAWKTSDDLVGNLELLQQRLGSLAIDHPVDTGALSTADCSKVTQADLEKMGWSSWDKCYDAAFKLLQTNLSNTLDDAKQWLSDSDKAHAFEDSLRVLRFWAARLAGMTPDEFLLQSDASCGVLFNQSQPIIVNLYTVDETGRFPGQTLAANPSSTPLLTVNCSSAFAVTAGAGFSAIKNPAYTIVQSAPPSGSTTPGSLVGMSSNSAINPYPLALAHARLHDWNDNRYAFHYSFGAGMNPTAGGGASAEFLTGLSISFLRTMFVTAGLDVGKKASLAGGYHVGDTVPSGVNSIPTTNSYTGGFGFAVTFTKP